MTEEVYESHKVMTFGYYLKKKIPVTGIFYSEPPTTKVAGFPPI